MIPLPSEFKKHKKFSITELYLMNLFQDKFYNNDKFDGVLKSCRYYVWQKVIIILLEIVELIVTFEIEALLILNVIFVVGL